MVVALSVPCHRQVFPGISVRLQRPRLLRQLLSRRAGKDTFFPHLLRRVFLPLLIRLAIEFGIFKKQLRGGLLINDTSGNTVLQSLAMSSNSNDEKFNTINHFTIVDDSFLDALVKLKEMGCIKKEDICDHDLLINICGSRNGNFFSFKRFQFLVECNPYALAHGMKLHKYLQCFLILLILLYKF